MRGSLTWSRVSWISSTLPAIRAGAVTVCLAKNRMLAVSSGLASTIFHGKPAAISMSTMV
ncbi:hypothetical protein D3C76_1237090 [compost metagenome]